MLNGVFLEKEEHDKLLSKIKILETENEGLKIGIDTLLGKMKLINWLDFSKMKYYVPKVFISETGMGLGDDGKSMLKVVIEYQLDADEFYKMKMKGY